MAAACGLTIVKRFTYRGDPTEEYSNTYWFTGTAPSGDTAWRALFDAVVAVEKAIYPADTTVVRGYGYNDDTGHKSGDTGAVSPAVFVVDMTSSPNTPVAGTFATSGYTRSAGDAAVVLRLKTSRLTSKGKPIYLRKFFHPAYWSSTNGPDIIGTAQLTALNALGAALHSGTLSGTHTLTAAGENDTIINHAGSNFITTRTLKRRGKRPNS